MHSIMKTLIPLVVSSYFIVCKTYMYWPVFVGKSDGIICLADFRNGRISPGETFSTDAATGCTFQTQRLQGE